MKSNIAIIITCFNRKELTLRCLSKIYELNTFIRIFLVDDGSTDGTSEVIEKTFPQINLIQGSGSLYWNRGMHLAWSEAAKFDFDFYLWMNDDILLFDNAIEELLECSQNKSHSCVISGIINNEASNKAIYGGFDQNRNLLEPNSKMQPITYMNGNVVLVPKRVFEVLGNLDPYFHHDLGDVDFGLRAIKNNIGVYTTTIAVGYGSENKINRERQRGAKIGKRFERLYSPLGSHPCKNFYFRKKHMNFFNAIGYFIFQHFINIASDGLLKKLRLYKYLR